MPSDDIVNRLRNIAALRGPMAGNVIPLACTEAVEEIQRLREIVEKQSSTIIQLKGNLGVDNHG